MDEAKRASPWRALVIDEVDEWALLKPTFNEKYPLIADLPTKIITVISRPIGPPTSPFAWPWLRHEQVYHDEVAVLSWRWDGDKDSSNPARRSTNIFPAVDYAKKHNIKYLLVDIVSIDQNLDNESKISKVVAFTQLYRNTRVFCAYNDHLSGMPFTMRRPWIYSEKNHMLSNTIDITVLVDMHRHFASWSDWPVERMIGLEKRDHDHEDDRHATVQGGSFEFATHLRRLSSDDFHPTVFSLMLGKVGMHDVSDLHYILPALGPVLSVAYKDMMKDDYLMTVALLSRALMKSFSKAIGVAAGSLVDVYWLRFHRYSLHMRSGVAMDPQNCLVIRFDGLMIETLFIGDGVSSKGAMSALSLTKDDDARIFSKLGMSKTA
jgi:hypothetical protein